MKPTSLDEMGYWLSPDGVEHYVYQAPWWCHAAWALELLTATGKTVSVERANAVLVRRGWIRVSQETIEIRRLGEREVRLIASFVRRQPLYMAIGSVEIFEAGPNRRRVLPVEELLNLAP